ncbi:MAG: PEGA domain-containing protein [Planctomycetota bacterium]|jgi:hypothetical protein
MGRLNLLALTVVVLIVGLFSVGCVERQLTINTEPQGAVVTLNDEEIGTSPVTVSFNWYGDYNVRINKEGYETLKTHRELKGPWYDKFPFDFFAQILSPKRIVDSYEWTFALAPKQWPTREELIRDAEELKKQLRGNHEIPAKEGMPRVDSTADSQPAR